MQRYILERVSTESENFHMNPLKKIYCRIFQNVFKFALPFLPYRNPEIISSLKAIPDVLKKKKCENVLILLDLFDDQRIGHTGKDYLPLDCQLP